MKKIKIAFLTGVIAFFAITFFSVKSYAFENQMIDVSNNTEVTNQSNERDLTSILYRDISKDFAQICLGKVFRGKA